MKPVDQTVTGVLGNCLAACAASILEVDLKQVDFACGNYPPGKWLQPFQDRLTPLGFRYTECRKLTTVKNFLEGSFFIATGPTKRLTLGSDLKPLLHSVVCKWDLDGAVEVVHDPHPSKTGLTEQWYYGVLVPVGSGKEKI